MWLRLRFSLYTVYDGSGLHPRRIWPEESLVKQIVMAKKKTNRTVPATTIQPETLVEKPQTPLNIKDNTRGSTDAFHVFDALLNDEDKEVLKDFPSHQRQLYGVIKSLYGDDVRLHPSRQNAWKKYLLAFQIVLQSLSDPSIFSRLDVELPPEYPKLAPKILLLESHPDKTILLPVIQKIIEDGVRTQLGDEYVVSNILSDIAEKLNEIADVEARRAQGGSLEDERATVESAAMIQASLQQEAERRQREADAAAKTARLTQDVEEQRQKMRKHTVTHNEEDSTTSNESTLKGRRVSFHTYTSCYDAHSDDQIRFRIVQPMSTIFAKESKSLTMACPVAGGEIIPISLALKELSLPEKLEAKDDPKVNLLNIETALRAAQDFQHTAIVEILNYKLEHISSPIPHWDLKILTQYADRGSLEAFLEMGELSVSKVRIHTRSILDALEYLDRKGYVHPAIHTHNVLFFSTKTMGIQAKLSDGYGTALREIVARSGIPSVATGLNSGNWAAPELIQGRSARTSKTCIWELGVVMLQMALGNDMTETYTSPEDALKRAGLDVDFDHLISKMCSTTARKRPSAFHLQSHQFFKSHAQSLFRDAEKPLGRSTTVPSLSREQSSLGTRWTSEWEAVGQLGKGGFGVVYKARNRLDSHFYAVKQIKCKSMSELDQIWSEVRMLAQLNHPSIVRYFGAWNEDDVADTSETDSGTVLTDERSFAPPKETGPLLSIFGMPSTGHDLMDPSLNEISDVESSQSDDENPFGYQSAPSASEMDDSRAVETDDEGTEADDLPAYPPIALDPAYDPFAPSSASKDESIPRIPSKPQPFRANAAEPSLLRRPSVYYNRKTTLYIQMELCKTGTLADMIKNGLPNNTDESWRLFRLILDALQYIHGTGVVHRDLKPANIFIDSSRMPKIGDFGLAAPGQASVNGQTSATHTAGPGSRAVGTKYYVPPELENATSTGHYSAKADMFALGVILFEMCFPFQTVAERWKWLEALNKDASELPPRFAEEKYKVQGRIVRMLLDQDPERRPSAKDLLLDPEVPEPLEEEKQQRFIQRLIEAEPEQFRKVINNFMNISATEAQSLAYAYVDDHTDLYDQYMLDAIQCQLEQVFRTHGGVSGMRQGIFPAEAMYPNAVRFLDPAGYSVQLPYDLTLPLARKVAVRKLAHAKHFCVGTVYRPREVGVEPLSIPEVDFDLVSYSARDLSFKDAQLISVLDDCFVKLSALFSRSFTLIINHSDLLDEILKYSGVPTSHSIAVKRVLSTLNVGKITWKQIQPQLQNMPIGLPSTVVATLAKFNFTGPISEVRQNVLNLFTTPSSDDSAIRSTRTLNRLQEIDGFLTSLQVNMAVLFSPLSNTSEALYQGSLMFKCIENRTQKPVVVGGRYDALIRTYETPAQRTGARAVGFRMNVKDLAVYARLDSQPGKLKTPKARSALPGVVMPRVAVVVTSFDEAILKRHCLGVFRNIIDAGFSAEVSEQYSTIDELDAAYDDPINYWLVIVRSTGSAQKAIRVRSPQRVETDLLASELIEFLREEIGGSVVNASSSEPTMKRMRSSHGAGNRDRVTVLTPEHRSKKINRKIVLDLAEASVQTMTKTMSTTYKVLAIDTDDETLHKLRSTRLNDAETWRTFRHTVPLTEREYTQEIQEQLETWADAGQEGAFIYNYKTKSCIFYDLGKS